MIPLVVLPEVLMYAPNAFTPDGDEHNQNWRIHIVGIDVYDFQLQLFDRWGELIWESRDPEAGWDGTFKGQPCQVGTYTWVVRAKDLLNDGQYVYNRTCDVVEVEVLLNLFSGNCIFCTHREVFAMLATMYLSKL